eukprot:9789501-Alexandrium_andersonii.AAC.1
MATRTARARARAGAPSGGAGVRARIRRADHRVPGAPAPSHAGSARPVSGGATARCGPCRWRLACAR